MKRISKNQELSQPPKPTPTDKYHSNKPETKCYRKTLRNNSTSAEAVFWSFLKNKQVDGYKFRRQFGIDHYILDFYCPEVKLAIELDGAVHFSAMAVEKDEIRTEYLSRKHGITLMRFENREVFDHPHWMIELIRNEIYRLSTPSPCGDSPYE